MNKENSKTEKSHKFVLNLSQRLDLRTTNKHVALQNPSIYYTWKKIRQQYKNDFELPHRFYLVSDIQDLVQYIIKNMIHYPLILLFIFTSAQLIID